jgi:hypothetical protein
MSGNEEQYIKSLHFLDSAVKIFPAGTSDFKQIANQVVAADILFNRYIRDRYGKQRRFSKSS